MKGNSLRSSLLLFRLVTLRVVLGMPFYWMKQGTCDILRGLMEAEHGFYQEDLHRESNG